MWVKPIMKTETVAIYLNFVLCLAWVLYKYFYDGALENIKIEVEVLSDKGTTVRDAV